MNFSSLILNVIILMSCLQKTTTKFGECDCSKAKFNPYSSVSDDMCGWYMGPANKSKPNECLENAVYRCASDLYSMKVEDCNKASAKKCKQNETGKPTKHGAKCYWYVTYMYIFLNLIFLHWLIKLDKNGYRFQNMRNLS
jgi:hypothetical protein